MKTTYYIEVLKDKVLEEFERKDINVKLTYILSDKIFEKTSQYISPSTLQRFFELISTKSVPSKTTLNILADYTGYDNWENFCRLQNDPVINLTDKGISLLPDEMALKLLEISLKNHNFKTVTDYLKLLPVDIDDIDLVLKISDIFGNIIRKDKKVRQALLPELAKLPQGRYYFYEAFVDVEFLHIYFADALNDYIKYSNPKDKEKYTRDLVFANSLHFLNYIKTNRKRKLIKQGFELTQLVNPNEANIDKINHHFPLVRYHSAYLIYLFLNDKLTDKIFDKTAEIIENQIILHPSDTTLILCEFSRALYLCGKYSELIFLYEKYKNNLDKKPTSSLKCLLNFVKLITANK